MKDGAGVERIVDSWVEVDDVVVADEHSAGRNAESGGECVVVVDHDVVDTSTDVIVEEFDRVVEG